MSQPNNKNEWIKTDDLQWRRQIDKTTFELVEVRELPDCYAVVSGIVDISDYDVEEEISGYYSSMDEFTRCYESCTEEERNGIIAECIFEQTELAELSTLEADDEEEAAKIAEEYIEKIWKGE